MVRSSGGAEWGTVHGHVLREMKKQAGAGEENRAPRRQVAGLKARLQDVRNRLRDEDVSRREARQLRRLAIRIKQRIRELREEG